VVNLAMLRNDLAKGGMDRVGRGNIAVVRGNLWCAEDTVFLALWEFRAVVLFRVGILLLEVCYQLFSLVLAFLLCTTVSKFLVARIGLQSKN
jgi:hypothetical protein